MKILHIGKYFSPFKGGIENMMLSLMQAQRHLGLTVSAAIHHHQTGQRYATRIVEGCRIYVIPIQTVLLFVPVALTALFHLKRIINTEKPDLLHCHMPNVTCFWLLLLPSARRIPWVIHWHSDVLGERPHGGVKLLYPVYRLLEKALLRKAHTIIVTSNNYLHSSTPLRPFRHKCRVVPLGLADHLPPKHIPAQSKASLLCVGRLTYYKGHEYLLKAMVLLNRSDITLTLIGTGEKEKDLRESADALGIASQVSFLGNVDDDTLQTHIENCTALILPSIERTEAFGLVLLEAMRAGKPCICTDVPGSGMNEVVVHEETGLVAKRMDAESLKSSINRLLNDEVMQVRMGKRGRERFQAYFETQHTTHQIVDIYQSMLSGSKR